MCHLCLNGYVTHAPKTTFTHVLFARHRMVPFSHLPAKRPVSRDLTICVYEAAFGYLIGVAILQPAFDRLTLHSAGLVPRALRPRQRETRYLPSEIVITASRSGRPLVLPAVAM